MMRDEVLSLQMRIGQLEGNVQQKEKALKSDGDSANQRIASTANRLDAIERDIQRIRGDIDTLRIGVTTGQLPGPDSKEGSLKQTLSDVISRLEAVEINQAELLEAIEKSVAKSKTKKGAEKSSEKDVKDRTKDKPPAGALKSVDDLSRAFAKKSYKDVLEAAPNVLSGTHSESVRNRVAFLQAESLFLLGNTKDAAIKYSDILETHPDSEKVPHIKLRLGDCFSSMGDKATARLFYEELVSKYAKSSTASKAKQRLAKLSG